jgi:hypothetical protein
VVIDGVIQPAMMDKFAFAGFLIPFVAVAVMHFDGNILSDALVRSSFYCKSIYNFFSAYLGKSLVLTAGLRYKKIVRQLLRARSACREVPPRPKPAVGQRPEKALTCPSIWKYITF